ncbi:MAG: GerMN domain-containing protein, partial [Angustibacter sp.]
TWVPSRTAVIYPDDASLRFALSGSGDRRSVLLRAPIWGHLTTAGELELAAPGELAEQRISLIRDGGSWRIDQLSEQFGLWMPRYEFDRSYLPIQINFAAITGATLVPDLRWFARTGPGLPTTIMRTLLSGPPAYLRFAVTSGAPSGTTLGLDAVPVSDGVARVDLSSNALKASTEQRSALWSQITATLGQLPSVQQVQITVDGLPFPLRREKGPVAVDGGTSPTVRIGPNFALRGAALARIDLPGARLVADLGTRFSEPPKLPGTRSMAIPNSLDAIITVTEPKQTPAGPTTRLLLQQTDRPARELGRATDLIRPVVDPAGWVWTADRQRPGSLLIAATDTAARPGFQQVR